MRKALIITVLVLWSASVMGQTSAIFADGQGLEKAQQWLLQKINIPQKAFRFAEICDELDGAVVQCSFEVDKSGRVQNVVVNGVHELFDDGFATPLWFMPRWQVPAKDKDGNAVTAYYVMTFGLNFKIPSPELEQKMMYDNRNDKKKQKRVETCSPEFAAQYPDFAPSMACDDSHRTLLIPVRRRLMQMTIYASALRQISIKLRFV